MDKKVLAPITGIIIEIISNCFLMIFKDIHKKTSEKEVKCVKITITN